MAGHHKGGGDKLTDKELLDLYLATFAVDERAMRHLWSNLMTHKRSKAAFRAFVANEFASTVMLRTRGTHRRADKVIDDLVRAAELPDETKRERYRRWLTQAWRAYLR